MVEGGRLSVVADELTAVEAVVVAVVVVVEPVVLLVCRLLAASWAR
jgi:hypothetical protein